MELSIQSNCEKDQCTLEVVGEIDVSNADSFRKALHDLIDKSPQRIVVDLSQAPYIDSTGIGVLMGANQNAQEKQVSLAVHCPHENIKRVFSMLGVDQQLEML